MGWVTGMVGCFFFSSALDTVSSGTEGGLDFSGSYLALSLAFLTHLSANLLPMAGNTFLKFEVKKT